MARTKQSGKRPQPNAAKPYPDFPLFRHATGQWAKKIRQKLHYFGVDADAALRKYTAERDDLQAGRTPRATPAGGITVRDLCNRFLTTKKRMQEAGELAPRTWRDYHDTCEIFIELIGRDRQVVDLVGDDFERLRATLSKGRGPVALGNQVRRIRSVLKYAFDADLVEKPVRFGPTFKQPSRKIVRKARQAAGGRMIEAVELREILDAAKQPLRAMILLGVNCGFGQTDVASLSRNAVDLERGWIDFPRPKTAVLRRCPLWPETIDTLREALADRPEPKDAADAGLIFITKFGNRFVRSRDRAEGGAVQIDTVAFEYRKLLLALDLKRSGNFYNLRHVFRTIADGAKDQPACDYIMGHLSEGMAVHYHERIDDGRLLAVAAVVHSWLWPELG